MSVTIYGASDDTIVVSGDVTEEFDAAADRIDRDMDGDLLTLSDGTVLRIEFTRSGVWRIQRLAGDPERLAIVQAPEDDEDNYSDRATIDGAIQWVAHSIGWARAGA